jgi:hypothetical protein
MFTLGFNWDRKKYLLHMGTSLNDGTEKDFTIWMMVQDIE